MYVDTMRPYKVFSSYLTKVGNGTKNEKSCPLGHSNTAVCCKPHPLPRPPLSLVPAWSSPCLEVVSTSCGAVSNLDRYIASFSTHVEYTVDVHVYTCTCS